MKIPIAISARHCHLKKSTYETLFGDDKIEVLKELKQPGEFASKSVVTIKSDEGVIENVRVLGPFRTYDQVEISKTDAFGLRINPPVRSSGKLNGAAPITIVGPKGEVFLEHGVIIASRHFHMTREMAENFEVADNQKYMINIENEKRGRMEVASKVMEEAYFELHIDTDDANAFLLENGDEVDIYL